MHGFMSKKAVGLITAAMMASMAAIMLMGAGQAAGKDVQPGIFSGGSGSAADPYTISNEAQMAAFRDSVNSGSTYDGEYVRLESDLDLGASEWVPIGLANRRSSGITGTSFSFKGDFNGNGHEISGLKISRTEGENFTVGLFGAVLAGTVQNLSLENVDINCPTSKVAGGAVGMMCEGATLEDVDVSGNVNALSGIGGLVGRMTVTGTIARCTNQANVSSSGGNGNVGGIVGAAYYSPEGSHMEITKCDNSGNITGSNDVGGIVGLCCAYVSDCTNTGEIEGSSYAVGGIAAELKNQGAATGNQNHGSVKSTGTSSPYGAGGIVGWVRYDGSGEAYALSNQINVERNSNDASIDAPAAIGVGGIVGMLYSSGTVSGNQNDASSISGKMFVSGIVGGIQPQGGALPPGIAEDAAVINNVSTTPPSAIAGRFSNPYSYNNEPGTYKVEDNGPAWVATLVSTGDERYASLSYAFSLAGDRDVVKLIADSSSNESLQTPASHGVTLELDGYDIGFAQNGGIAMTGASLTIEGEGDLYYDIRHEAEASAEALLATKTGKGGKPGKIILEGGSYPINVEEYVGPGFKMVLFEDPNAHGDICAVKPCVGSQNAAPSKKADANEGDASNAGKANASGSAADKKPRTSGAPKQHDLIRSGSRDNAAHSPHKTVAAKAVSPKRSGADDTSASMSADGNGKASGASTIIEGSSISVNAVPSPILITCLIIILAIASATAAAMILHGRRKGQKR